MAEQNADAGRGIESIETGNLEMFREIGNIGAGNAATALAGILNRRIDMSVPEVRIVPFDTILNILDGPETVVAGILVDMTGDLNGYILMVLTVEDAGNMVSIALESMAPDVKPTGNLLEAGFSEIEQSALSEISNILVGSFLSAISSLTGLSITPSAPVMTIDMLGAIMSVAAIEYGKMGDSVLFLETKFLEESRNTAGNFFLIPDYQSYKTLIASLGLA